MSTAAPAERREDREYGARALLGLAVPQANPVVEAEFTALMPAGVGFITTRLQGSRSNSRDRLIQYLDSLDASLENFDTARPDALGYACTGTSYLVEPEREARQIQASSERFGYPIITSAAAILAALRELGARRIALLAPYPQWMVDVSHRYWETQGLQVTAQARTLLDTTDTRHVYRVRTPMVLQAAQSMNLDDADVVLMSGTGMPTLRAIPEIARHSGKPVLSSNLCLAWALLRAAGVDFPAPRPQLGETLLGGWVERTAAL